MVNNRLKSLYDQVFQQIYPQIKDEGRGVLHKVMHTILYEEQKRATSICNYLDIKPSATIADDRKIIEGLISNPEDLSLNNLFIKDKKMEISWIVVIACTLTGVYSCYRYIEYTKEKKAIQPKYASTQNLPTSPTPKPKKLIPADLCLIVTALAIGNLTENSPIHVSEIEQLIDNSLYFLCTSVADANMIWDVLEKTEEDIKTLSEEREVYIRINIPDGEEMIGKKVPYILKRNLPSRGECIIKQLACLKYLSVSGLEKFNRV